MNLNYVENVRNSCKSVAEKAIFVKIDYERLPSYAKSLPLDRIISPELDSDRHFLGRGPETAAFFITLDSINFGSGFFPFLRKRPGMSGYFTVAASLNDFFNAHGPIPAEKLSEFLPEDCAKIFDQDLDNAPIRELMTLFSKALNDLGRFLLDHFNGSFTNLIDAADFSAEKLLSLLIQMPFFNDVESYHGFDTHFYKRAQLTAADLSIVCKDSSLGRFDDLHRLTMFADNLVPHVLRIDNILLYDESLASRIDSDILIPPGAPEEIEMRACAVHSVELLVSELHKSGFDSKAMDIDYLLWNRGQEPFYKKIKPRHRSRSVYY